MALGVNIGGGKWLAAHDECGNRFTGFRATFPPGHSDCVPGWNTGNQPVLVVAEGGAHSLARNQIRLRPATVEEVEVARWMERNSCRHSMNTPPSRFLDEMNILLEAHGGFRPMVEWRNAMLAKIHELPPEDEDGIVEEVTAISCLLEDIWELTRLSGEHLLDVPLDHLRMLIAEGFVLNRD